MNKGPHMHQCDFYSPPLPQSAHISWPATGHLFCPGVKIVFGPVGIIALALGRSVTTLFGGTWVGGGSGWEEGGRKKSDWCSWGPLFMIPQWDEKLMRWGGVSVSYMVVMGGWGE